MVPPLYAYMDETKNGANVGLDVSDSLERLRKGTPLSGPVQPHRWMDLVGQRKTGQELMIERGMESCMFKTGISSVIGKINGTCFRIINSLYCRIWVGCCTRPFYRWCRI